MSLIVRQAEAGWSAILEMQKRENVQGIKCVIATAGPVPPNNNGSRNLNNIVNIKKYFEMLKYNNTNKLVNLKLNINKQNLTKFLKYLA